MKDRIKVIAFDADDTLWINEPYFRVFEEDYFNLMAHYMPKEALKAKLFDLVIKNIPMYGYGTRGLSLSMLEGAVLFSNGKVKANEVLEILNFGKRMLGNPVELIDGVEETLAYLSNKYRLVVATKGDLLEQEKKLEKSNLLKYFHHTEIVSEKTEKEYSKLLQHLDIEADEFLMVGNSLKSDIVPVLNIGAHAFHVPFHSTWAHEMVDGIVEGEKFRELKKITEVIEIL
ncbi:HAD family hydrolase [Flammeovirga kamogawensis]|uniref:HAD family hydrolase n=1 Tax=Flammeovirga kamogawensis TaxID=373891 RepID=A0ABX8H2D2_9BACT|nr:HAD family hydrolase [Flammeovirga kamogawensis]MBB6463943.1 putative hydrolase of the HAD superfamily [Flammeovirga kamogawensis]QWG09779.1 HAD family hydrolase [Flammeovirga kamogawensis]TRX65289.1 HAD family hydrolase [Flammeovirga kamogawensis]